MRTFITVLAALGGASLMAPALAHDGHNNRNYHGADSQRDGHYSRDYRGGNGYRGDHRYRQRLPRNLEVSDRTRLDPWLAYSWEGRKFVREHYDVSRWNTISEDNAENANVFFRRWADIDRDYRLTDAEIRTALDHIANDYGLPHRDGRVTIPAHGGDHHGRHRPDGPPDALCDAEAAQHLIGEQASEELGDEALHWTGARDLRWIAPDSAVTLDYRPDRLNIEYDRDGWVLDIKCE